VLAKALETPFHAARIGGDEFAILLPATDERGGAAMIDTIRQLVDLNNQFYHGARMSLAVGAATCGPGERLEQVMRLADARMYDAKRQHYSAVVHDRRR
jgi:diguanylate cyclase (GGDEF)-like protein